MYTLEDYEKSMEGVIHDTPEKVKFGKLKGTFDVSESPMGYKEIDTVMKNQEDLVEIVHKLKPSALLKG